MRRNPFAAALIVLGSIPACAGHPTDPGSASGLPSISPEEAGFSSLRLRTAREHYNRIGSAAFLALYDGKVFVSWGEVDREYWLHSIRKPLLGALYGIAVARGQIDTSATLADLGIDDIPPSLTPEEKQARVVDLLKSQSGVYHLAAAETEDMAAERPARGSHPPGTFHYYNNWDFNVLGTIYEHQTGTGIFEAFKREIADPIGMVDFEVADGSYEYESGKSLHPAYGFRMTARDLARFGVLFQQNGAWGGQQFIPPSWIAASWTPYAVHDSALGLGFGLMWGTISAESPLGVGPAYLFAGLGVHYLVIVPRYKLVLVHRVDTDRPWSITSEQAGELLRLVVAARVSN